MVLRVSVDNRDVQAALSRLSSHTTNLQPAFKNIGEYLVLRTQERFDDQQDPKGQRWQPLKASTLARKTRLRKILKILQQDGDLRTSIAYQATNRDVSIGTNRVYGAIHQFGGMAGRGRRVRIPPRPYLGVDDADRAEIVEIIEEHLRPPSTGQ
ncbi:MAG: phage virion morphogenesis protein [Jaaginema sp. PMC 1079.18]|nr:phage virion morphogenesis protein [Jaaginema sp. PMC 1080.18]MEC4850116.1 phage virion morphogenesis protein [Jaaginema sp. PMC 1079.18]MEC4864796.1 phage virion morphogenesis protein [Jaaginema sp. PMC 1078.18]